MSRSPHQFKPWGWIFLALGLVFSSFIGGALRVALSEDYLKSKLNKIIDEQSQYQVLYESVNVQLSDYLLPVFYIKIKNLEIKPKNICIDAWGWTTPEMTLKTAMIKSLLKKKFSLESIGSSQGTFKKYSAQCAEESKTKEIKAEEAFDVVEKRFDVSSLPRIEVDDLWLELDRFYLRFKDVEIREKDKKIDLDFTVDFERFGETFKGVRPMQGSMQVGQSNTIFRLNGKLNSGSINIQAQGEGFSGRLFTELQLDSKNLPIENIVEFLNLTGFTKTKVSRSPLWLNCSLMLNLKQSHLYAHPDIPCKIDSIGSSLQVKNLSFKENRLDPFSVQFNAVPMKLLFQSFSVDGLQSVFPDPGIVSGLLKYESVSNVEFEWNIENASLYFSKKGQAVINIIKKMHGFMSWNGERVSGKIDDVQLNGGEFAGLISFNSDKSFSKTHLQAAVEKIRFSKTVNNIFFGSKVSGFSFFGKGSIDHGELSHWNGKLGLLTAQAPSFVLENLKADISYKKGSPITVKSTFSLLGFTEHFRKQIEILLDQNLGMEYRIPKVKSEVVFFPQKSFEGVFKLFPTLGKAPMPPLAVAVTEENDRYKGTLSFDRSGKKVKWLFVSEWPKVDAQLDSGVKRAQLNFKEGLLNKAFKKVISK